MEEKAGSREGYFKMGKITTACLYKKGDDPGER